MIIRLMSKEVKEMSLRVLTCLNMFVNLIYNCETVYSFIRNGLKAMCHCLVFDVFNSPECCNVFWKGFICCVFFCPSM